MTDFGLAVETDGKDGWAVSLPHRCDRWVIAGDINYRQYVSREEAIRELRDFGIQVEKALIALGICHTYGEPTIGEMSSWLA